MAVDEQGLVHGGFVFGLADHARCWRSTTRTSCSARRAPASCGRCGSAIVAGAPPAGSRKGAKHILVEVRGEEPVMTGEFNLARAGRLRAKTCSQVHVCKYMSASTSHTARGSAASA
jgi:hypothetical protein